MIKGCPKCQAAVIKAEDNFCWSCGTKLENIETPRCHCGYHFMPADSFCPNCGASKEVMTKRIADEKKKKEEALKLAQLRG